MHTFYCTAMQLFRLNVKLLYFAVSIVVAVVVVLVPERACTRIISQVDQVSQ